MTENRQLQLHTPVLRWDVGYSQKLARTCGDHRLELRLDRCRYVWIWVYVREVEKVIETEEEVETSEQSECGWKGKGD